MSSRHTIAQSPADAAFHKDNFSLFCELELDAGGPDSHMATFGHMNQDVPVAERIWRAGCYIAPYSLGAAAGIWRSWDLEHAVEHGEDLEDWLRNNWHGLPIRRERRAVKSVPKLTRCLREYALWADRGSNLSVRFKSYDEAWDSVRSGVTFFGRYSTIKLLETLHRYCGLEHGQYDIRARGAWSPRLTLSYMYPEYDGELNSSSDSPAVLKLANDLAADTFARVTGRVGDRLTYFKLEVLLCNYRQALERKYPGRVHDSELALFYKAEKYWAWRWPPVEADAKLFYEARAALFPHRCLGELNGWDGTRDELNYPEIGGFWSDMLYDYNATTDVSKPVRWPE